MEMFGLWGDCRTGHSGGSAIEGSGLPTKQTNEEVYYEKNWARIIGFHLRFIFGWLLVYSEATGGRDPSACGSQTGSSAPAAACRSQTGSSG